MISQHLTTSAAREPSERYKESLKRNKFPGKTHNLSYNGRVVPRRVLIADNNLCNSLETMGFIKPLVFNVAGI